ncbi:MAG TPA: hypothetical protein VES02_12030 [Dermatophilaceae bacterium]|nr:hypothetical protein [Dermatophilaceae bacterium]
MKVSAALAAACGGAILAVVLGSYLQDPHATRSGQIVFIPGSSIAATEVSHSLGAVTILDCLTTPKGLSVTGIVETEAELATVLVRAGHGSTAGVAVGNGAPPPGSSVSDGGSGRFVITLPWASVSSTFAQVDADSWGVPGAEPVTGDWSRCPDTR